MDLTTILYIVGALIVGLLLGLFLFKKNTPKVSSKEGIDDKVKGIEQEHARKIGALHKEIEQRDAALKENERKAADIKARYEKLLAESKEELNELNQKMKLYLDGDSGKAIEKELQEIDKLKKKLKELEEENEEFEEDLEDANKKLKNKERAYNELQEQFEKTVREMKAVKQELDSVVAELDNKKAELELKMESLAFVQEVLSAPRTSDASINKLYENIDRIKNYIKEDGKRAITDLCTLTPNVQDELFGTGLDAWESTAKKSWIKGKTSVAFVGEFSAGKTSIVNRILSQDDPNIPRLPVSTKATTAIPTYISGGVGTFYQFVTPNNELKSISENTFKRVSKEVLDQVKGVSSLIQYFVMTYKNANLNNLSILDTPGFNSNDKEDAERTIEVINECDALFWVFDVNAGTINRSSIELIKQHLKKPLYVVINKVDTKSKGEVDKVENLIRQTLTKAQLNVNAYIRFSSKSPLSDMMNPIKQIKHDNSRENYLETLLQAINVWADAQEKDVNKAKQRAGTCRSQSKNLDEKYITAVNQLINACNRVSNIPEFVEHIFRKDNYEMSKEDYGEMSLLLKFICDNCCDDLCNIYDDQKNKRGELEAAWKEQRDAEMLWQQINLVRTTLQRFANELKKQ